MEETPGPFLGVAVYHRRKDPKSMLYFQRDSVQSSSFSLQSSGFSSNLKVELRTGSN